MRVKERRDLVMKRGLCMNCFKWGHLCRNCPESFSCEIVGCGLKHSKFLHFNPPRQEPTMRNNTSETNQVLGTSEQSEPSQVETQQNTNYTRSNSGKLAMPIVAARVYNPDSGKYMDTYALLDPGSNGTYCTVALQKQLGAKGVEHSMELTTLTSTNMPLKTTAVKLDITSVSGGPKFKIDVIVQPNLNIDTSGIASPMDIAKWPHLKDLSIPELSIDEVHLLIGQDSSDLLVPEAVQRGKRGEPFATLSPLGWTINGPINPGRLQKTSHFIQAKTHLESNMKDAYKEETGWSTDNMTTIHTWKKSITSEENHYAMNIPFKEEPPSLLNNKEMAVKKLISLSKGLERERELKTDLEIDKSIEQGYTEEAPEEEMNQTDGKEWHLPHHPVHNLKKPEKCSIVFNGAAKHYGSSLNDNPIDNDSRNQRNKWKVDLPILKQFYIPRCTRPNTVSIKDTQLHDFSDAPELAYGTASYMRMRLEREGGQESMRLCMRLEREGGLESMRLDKTLTTELSIPLQPSAYWTDSQIVLWCTNNTEKCFLIYVTNKVLTLTEHTKPERWKSW